jgi:hypothetical protein
MFLYVPFLRSAKRPLVGTFLYHFLKTHFLPIIGLNGDPIIWVITTPPISDTPVTFSI